jgi:hypothetical protein
MYSCSTRPLTFFDRVGVRSPRLHSRTPCDSSHGVFCALVAFVGELASANQRLELQVRQRPAQRCSWGVTDVETDFNVRFDDAARCNPPAVVERVKQEWARAVELWGWNQQQRPTALSKKFRNCP